VELQLTDQNKGGSKPESASYGHSLYTYEHTRNTPVQETPITLPSNPRGRGEPNPLQNFQRHTHFTVVIKFRCLRKLKDLDVNMNIVLCIITDEEEDDDVHLIGVVPTVPDNLSALKKCLHHEKRGT
jgi:hypothetical protein